MNRNKHDIITFKVDETLRELMNGIENRSEFIRSAILTALDSACPLCKGTGVLTPSSNPLTPSDSLIRTGTSTQYPGALLSGYKSNNSNWLDAQSYPFV